MYAAVKFLVALATWLGLILAITGHAVADERNTMLVAVVLVIEGQERVMNPPSVVWTLSDIQAVERMAAHRAEEAAYNTEQAANWEAKQPAAQLAAQADRAAAYAEIEAKVNEFAARQAEAAAEAARWLAKQAEEEQVAATAEEGSFTQAAAELAVKNYAYRADLAARKAAENAKYMANAKASGPTKERLNSSVAASNARYTVEQAEFFRKRATKAMAESKQFADQAAQAQ